MTITIKWRRAPLRQDLLGDLLGHLLCIFGRRHDQGGRRWRKEKKPSYVCIYIYIYIFFSVYIYIYFYIYISILIYSGSHLKKCLVVTPTLLIRNGISDSSAAKTAPKTAAAFDEFAMSITKCVSSVQYGKKTEITCDHRPLMFVTPVSGKHTVCY